MELRTTLGEPVYVSAHCLAPHWVFPSDRFVEYESTDESWCRKLGIGSEQWKPAAYKTPMGFVMHPDILAQIPFHQTGVPS